MSKLVLAVVLAFASAASVIPALAQTHQDCSAGGCATPSHPSNESTRP